MSKCILIRATCIETGTHYFFNTTPERYSTNKWIKNPLKCIVLPSEKQETLPEQLYEAALLSLDDSGTPLKNVSVLDVGFTFTNSMQIDNDEIQQIKQKVALSKLNIEDIKALGLETDATFFRLNDSVDFNPKPKSSLVQNQGLVLNQVDIDGLLGFDNADEDEDDNNDAMAAAWESAMGTDNDEDDGKDDLASEWAVMLGESDDNS